jgi:hypothetical protein
MIAGILAFIISDKLHLTGLIDDDSIFLLMINSETPLHSSESACVISFLRLLQQLSDFEYISKGNIVSDISLAF